MSLSYDEAVGFLKDVLQMPSDLIGLLPLSLEPRSSSREKHALLLHHIINSFLAVEPFQSISLMSTDTTDRKRPDWSDIKRSMFLKQGGLCYSLNSFFFVLLKTLGYQASLAHSTVVFGDLPCPDNHVVILLRSWLESGDLFLIDVGVGFSMARALPLDFEKESPVYVDSYHTYKLTRRSRNKIFLLQQPVKSVLQKGMFKWKDLEINCSETAVPYKTFSQARTLPADVDKDLDGVMQDSNWSDFYFFDSTEEHVQLDEFFPCFDVCFGDVRKLTMHSSLRALSWPGGRLQAILHSKISLENSRGVLLKYEIGDIKMDSGNSDNNNSTGTETTDSTVSIQSCDSNPSDDQESFKSNASKDSQETKGITQEPDVKIMEAYRRLFPQFPRTMVAAALQNWRKSVAPKDLPGYFN